MPTEQKQKGNEDYKFIQEKVVPQKSKKLKRALSMTGAAVVLGVIFGLAGSAAFCLSEPWMDRLLGREQGNGQGGIQLSDADDVTSGGENPVDGNDGGTSGDGASGSGNGGASNVGTAGSKENGTDSGQNNTELPDGSGETSSGGQNGASEGTDGAGETGSGADGISGADGQGTDSQSVVIEHRIPGSISDFKNIYHEIGVMASEVNRSIVEVTGVISGFDWFQNPYETEASTSGVILAVDETDIYVLVGYHPVEQANEIRVSFDQNVSAIATLRDAQPDLGLAVVSVQKTDLPYMLSEGIAPVKLGESFSLEVGEPVVALGNPNGYLYSMLLGMVTNKVNYAYVADHRLELFNTDIELGNEGEGIIVNLEGHLVGIITRQLGENQELCKVLSISRIKSVLERMINQEPRIYMGIIGMDLQPELAEKLEVTGGVYVTDVENGSPAGIAGIRKGDVILQVGEDPVSAMTAYSSALQNFKPGEETTVKVCRMVRQDAVVQDIVVTLEQKNVLMK